MIGKKLTTDQIWDILEMYGVATNEELQLATSLKGYKPETLMEVLDIRTGYKNILEWLHDSGFSEDEIYLGE